MSDRFKFRVWNIQKDEIKYDVLDDLEFYLKYDEIFDVMQCTGLKDKNGKLIYEGDVVKFNKKFHWKPKQIIWDECHYILKDTQILLCNMEVEQFGLEVIGNIYENKDLLNENI